LKGYHFGKNYNLHEVPYMLTFTGQFSEHSLGQKLKGVDHLTIYVLKSGASQ